jgi:hypothetical protein
MDDHLTLIGELHSRPWVSKDGEDPIAYMPVRLERIELGDNSTCIGLTIIIRGENALACRRFKKHQRIAFCGRLGFEAWPDDEPTDR